MKNSTSLRLLKSFGCSSKFILTMTYALIFSGINIFADDIQVGETTRNAIIYAPENLPVNSPLLISMHGMSQDANYQKNQSKWESVADTAKFALGYPNGISNSWDISGDRDIEYILAIIDTMANRYQNDRTRVYLSGFSMGGMMTYHAANKIADKIAAFAPVSGVPMWGGTYNSSRPIPIIHVHGDADEVVTYDNRIVPYLEGWVKRNNCSDTPIITNPYPANKPYCGSYKTHWGNGNEGTEITLLTLGGKGHWHSNDPNGVMSSAEIWNFVKRYSLNPGAPIVNITSPSNNKVIEADEAITISTTITKTEGEITKVKFFDGKTLLATVEEAPYEYRWENIPVGEHTILVVAYNSENKKGNASVNISVNAPRGPIWIGSLPETNSFDLKAESLNFAFFFNEKVNTDVAKATLKGDISETELVVEKNGWNETLNISLPENFTPEQGQYNLSTTKTINENKILTRDN